MKQFSVYRTNNSSFPLDVLTGFLPEWHKRVKIFLTQWHFLFEPCCLVRFTSIDDVIVLNTAKRVAKDYGLTFKVGDVDSSSGEQVSGEDFPVETAIVYYKSKELQEANFKFLQAISELSLEIAKANMGDFIRLAGKHTHLLLNCLGMNYSEEAIFYQLRAERAKELYVEYVHR